MKLVNPTRAPIPAGKDLLIVLYLIAMLCNFVNTEILEGMMHNKLADLMDSDARVVRVPMDEGRVPEKINWAQEKVMRVTSEFIVVAV